MPMAAGTIRKRWEDTLDTTGHDDSTAPAAPSSVAAE
jgi:hypothetical protein